MSDYEGADRRRTDEIKHELDEIRAEVFKKQDKIKPGVWGTFVGTIVLIIISVVGSHVRTQTELTTVATKLDALFAVVESGTADRYRGSQAAQDFKLRDQRMEFLQEQINSLKHEYDKHEEQDCHDGACIEIEKWKLHEKESEQWKERIIRNGKQ